MDCVGQEKLKPDEGGACVNHTGLNDTRFFVLTHCE